MNPKQRLLKRASQKGGVALEYVLVTSFATILALALLGIATTTSKGQLLKMATKLGFEVEGVEKLTALEGEES